MRTGGVEIKLHPFSTSALDGVVSFTHRSLYPHGKSPSYPLDRRLGEFQSRGGHGVKEKNSQRMSGLEPRIIQLVAQRYTTEVSVTASCLKTVGIVSLQR
jgi:hypothetical protein